MRIWPNAARSWKCQTPDRLSLGHTPGPHWSSSRWWIFFCIKHSDHAKNFVGPLEKFWDVSQLFLLGNFRDNVTFSAWRAPRKSLGTYFNVKLKNKLRPLSSLFWPDRWAKNNSKRAKNHWLVEMIWIEVWRRQRRCLFRYFIQAPIQLSAGSVTIQNQEGTSWF